MPLFSAQYIHFEAPVIIYGFLGHVLFSPYKGLIFKIIGAVHQLRHLDRRGGQKFPKLFCKKATKGEGGGEKITDFDNIVYGRTLLSFITHCTKNR